MNEYCSFNILVVMHEMSGFLNILLARTTREFFAQQDLVKHNNNRTLKYVQLSQHVLYKIVLKDFFKIVFVTHCYEIKSVLN